MVATGSESLTSTAYGLLSSILDQFICSYENRLKIAQDAIDQKLSPKSVGDETPKSTVVSLRNSWSHKNTAFNTFDTPSEFQSSRNKCERFINWVNALLVATSVDLNGNIKANDLEFIDEYPIQDLFHLISKVYPDIIPELPSPRSTVPDLTPPPPPLTPANFHTPLKSQDELLRSLLVRTIRAAAELQRTVIIVDNLQWCDELSALALIDLIKSSESGFGIFCHRNTVNSIITESSLFKSISAIRDGSQFMYLPPLNIAEVSELAYHIMGASYHSALSRAKLSRIRTRTQGIPGLIESLVSALRDEAERGHHPNIEDIRIPVKFYFFIFFLSFFAFLFHLV